jgi:hypothetical protein
MAKNFKKTLGFFAGAALSLAGLTPNSIVSANQSAVNYGVTQQQATVKDEKQTPIVRKRKRTPLGTAMPGRLKHQFTLVAKKHKKHTNRNHLKAKHRRKRIRAKK